VFTLEFLRNQELGFLGRQEFVRNWSLPHIEQALYNSLIIKGFHFEPQKRKVL